MADNNQSLPMRGYRLALDIATGRHFLSRLIPPLLLALDAMICVVIIQRVACELIGLLARVFRTC